MTADGARALPPTVKRYFLARIKKNGRCWLWTGSINYDGYGTASIRPLGGMRAHRLALILDGRDVPLGMLVDHLCRVRHCVNPRHLEVVTNRENILRGNGAPARNARKTHCRFGHKYDYKMRTTGQRMCRICNRAYKRFVRAMEREALEKQRKAVEALAGREKNNGNP